MFPPAFVLRGGSGAAASGFAAFLSRTYRVRLDSARSVWRRRPADPAAVLPYLAMSVLSKRSNGLWHLLIRYRLTGLAGRPLVEWTGRRHLGFRRLERGRGRPAGRAPPVVWAGC